MNSVISDNLLIIEASATISTGGQSIKIQSYSAFNVLNICSKRRSNNSSVGFGGIVPTGITSKPG